MQKKLVIFISRDRLKVGWVGLGKNPKLTGVKEYPWKEKKLAEALERVKADFKYEKILVVFSDTLSYILRFEVPKEEKDVREYVIGKIAEGIPEILENDYWDYKEIEKSKKGKKVEVFAPVKDSLGQLMRAAKKAGLEVEVVEPSSLSSTRYQEPMIGVAMKKDIKSKDEEVLNVEPPKVVVVEEEAWEKEEEDNNNKKEMIEEEIREEVEMELSEEAEQAEGKEEEIKGELKTEAVMEEVKPKKKGKLTTILLFVLIIAAIGGGVFLFTKIRGGKQSETEPTPATEVVETPTPTPEPELNRADLTVQVLNGTGEPGAAGGGKDLLEELGYGEVETGNADSYSYEESEISLKEEKADYFDLLYADLSTGYLVSSKLLVLDEDSEYDVVIVLGKVAEVDEEEAVAEEEVGEEGEETEEVGEEE